ncbi:hypothetical protein HOLleu_04277 [Holothuria leucospilota]|uniref:Uncharacterized protein n=1 Tax=Holothuria leucospilota TaxID=206669 RepID=A0A9Q1CU04_HOLLE|nr:hypothetical protein HOLleu_04277 [Holothuria leucospilota]
MKFLLVTLLSAVASAAFAPLRTSRERITGSYIVVLKDEESLTDAVKTLKSSPKFSSFKGRINKVYGSVLNGFSATLNEQALKYIRSLDNVKYVEEDGIARVSSVASWGLGRIDQRYLPLDDIYNPPGTGAGVTVYVIDTGIAHTHVDFGGRAEPGFDFAGGSGEDCHGHGTHCAGTVGGRTYGVAKCVKLKSVRVLDCFGSGTWSDVIAGVDFTARDCGGGRCVASMSLGGPRSSSVDNAVANAVSNGVVVVVAAGNSNDTACDYSPAGEPTAITVGATQSDDERSFFSNYGPCVDLFAPGSAITSAWYFSETASNTISGTSMACPHVSGAAALLLERGVSADNVPSTIIREATKGVVIDPGSCSPNEFLCVK